MVEEAKAILGFFYYGYAKKALETSIIEIATVFFGMLARISKFVEN